MNAETRFFAKVNKTPTCWLWSGAIDIGGYGRFWMDGKMMPAHHFLVRNEIPNGKLVLHKCDVRNCVNPSHLFFGTSADNTHDMHAKGRANQRPGWVGMMKVRKVHTGEDNHKSKLTKADVMRIRSITPRFGLAAELAMEYRVSHAAITKILKGESWKHLL